MVRLLLADVGAGAGTGGAGVTPDPSKIGGSDLAGILGLSPWGTPLAVYARIVGGVQQEDSAPLRRGRALEQAVREMYLGECPDGTFLRGPQTLAHRLPCARASLDDVVATTTTRGDRVLEIKTAGLTEIRRWGESGTDAIPQQYVYQCTWYGGVALSHGIVSTGTVDVAALVAGDLRVYHVPHDPELYGLLEQAVERFWADHVLPRRPPPVTEPLRDVEAVTRLYPADDGDARRWESLSTPEQVAVREWLRARAARRAAEAEEAAWEVRAKLALGTAPQLLGLPEDTGARRIDWRRNKPSTATDWESVARSLSSHIGADAFRRVVDGFTTQKPGARPFVVRELHEEE